MQLFFTLLAIFALTMFVSKIANAEEVTISWNPPIERENNSPLPLSDIASFNIYNAADNTDVVTGIANTITSIVHDFPFGTHNLVMTAVDTEGGGFYV